MREHDRFLVRLIREKKFRKEIFSKKNFILLFICLLLLNIFVTWKNYNIILPYNKNQGLCTYWGYGWSKSSKKCQDLTILPNSDPICLQMGLYSTVKLKVLYRALKVFYNAARKILMAKYFYRKGKIRKKVENRQWLTVIVSLRRCCLNILENIRK